MPDAALGSNDLKTKFGREPEAIATALEGYIDKIERTAWTRTGGAPAVLLVSPIHLDADQPTFGEKSSEYDADSVRKSRELGTAIRRVADKRKALFVDAATVARPAIDGVHLSHDSHESLSNMITQVIRKNSR